MSLHNKLKTVKEKGEEKTIALRMPKSKVSILEKLAAYYDLNTSALIREMIDDSIMKLQKDLIVLPDELGVKFTSDTGRENLITYFPDIVALYTNDSYPYSFDLEDCKCNEDLLDRNVIEDARLSVECGLSFSHSGIAPISEKEYNFTKKGEI
jgi:hypothetical protein